MSLVEYNRGLHLMVMLCLLAGCRTADGAGKGVSRSLTVPLLSFAQSQAGAGGIIRFPTLEIFDRDGALVYLGSNAGSNAALVKALPGLFPGLRKIPGRMELAAVIDKLPGLNAEDRESLLGNRLPTVVSIDLDQCEACAVQDRALAGDAKSLLSAQGFNTFLIRVSR